VASPPTHRAFLPRKKKKPTPLRSTVRGTSSSAPPCHPRRLRRHRRSQTSLNPQCPSSTPPRHPCCLRRPRHPCRRAAPVVWAVPGQLAVPVVHTAAAPLLSAAPPSSVPPRRPRCPDRPRPASSPRQGQERPERRNRVVITAGAREAVIGSPYSLWSFPGCFRWSRFPDLVGKRATVGQSSSIESNQNSISWILVHVYVLLDAPRGNHSQQFKHVLFDLIKIAFLWFM
jgi:hypothetical protein